MKMKSIALILFGAAAMTACTGGSENKAEKEVPAFNSVLDSLSYALGLGYSAPEAEMKMVLNNSGSDGAFVEQLLAGVEDGVNGGDKEKLAYFIGLQAGMNMRNDIIEEAERQIFGDDTTQHLNLDNFIAGFRDVVYNKHEFMVDSVVLMPKQAAGYVQEIIDKASFRVMSQKYSKEYEANEAFMAAKAKEAGIDSLDNGILYKVITPGKGPKPSEGNTVSIEYEGRLIDGKIITKSHAITDVMVKDGILNFPGFTMMVTNMPLNAEWEAYIPWMYCYGIHGYSDEIPPFSNIILKVKLHDIK